MLKENTEYEVRIPIGREKNLEGILEIPRNSTKFVIFIHGSGSSRFSPRNMFVAKYLQKQSIGTLLIDLLTQVEDEIYSNRFNIDLLTDRVVEITNWVKKELKHKNFFFGYFGASTGAAAALEAAAEMGSEISAIVSRGGRPDLAIDFISSVKSPTLLIIGGEDKEVIDLNKKAYEFLKCTKKMEIIKGATHLFEEPGKLENVAKIAKECFSDFLK